MKFYRFTAHGRAGHGGQAFPPAARNTAEYINGRPRRSVETLSSKVFIEFVVLIVRNRIYNLLKENTLQMESRPNYMTVPAAIRELEKIEMVKRNDGSYRLDHAISKRQKTILASFGMDVTSFKEISNDIIALLAKNQSLLASSNSTDEIDE